LGDRDPQQIEDMRPDQYAERHADHRLRRQPPPVDMARGGAEQNKHGGDGEQQPPGMDELH
jgi:hypothetical protein